MKRQAHRFSYGVKEFKCDGGGVFHDVQVFCRHEPTRADESRVY